MGTTIDWKFMEFDCTYRLQSRGLGRSSNEVDNVNNLFIS
jgi:hypothetical protein